VVANPQGHAELVDRREHVLPAAARAALFAAIAAWACAHR
jgi:hypothetical protein